MTDSVIVMPGSGRAEWLALEPAAREFGWEVDVVHDLRKAAAVQVRRNIVAVFVERDALGAGYSWIETIRQVKRALPEARVIACHGFSEAIDWPELCDAGAFHALWLPLKDNEVRQSLGFVWEAEKRGEFRRVRSHLIARVAS